MATSWAGWGRPVQFWADPNLSGESGGLDRSQQILSRPVQKTSTLLMYLQVPSAKQQPPLHGTDIHSGAGPLSAPAKVTVSTCITATAIKEHEDGMTTEYESN
ncbi:hypothetical protein EDC04DRAFT_2611975 [Pisolithus marmoratus]|nr:hypothetical protein EDC04DRAFT_2611975 [Pisolithus marmoratus]